MIESLDPDTIYVLATIVGEAGNSSNAAWKAVTHVICNRVGKHEWIRMATPGTVCRKSGFDAATQFTPGFRAALEYYSARQSVNPDPHLEEILLAVHPILKGLVPDDTGDALLYYSPRTQAAMHARFPEQYALQPHWDFSLLKEVFPPNMEKADDFRFFSYA